MTTGRNIERRTLEDLVSGRLTLSRVLETFASVLANESDASPPLRTFFDSYGDLRFTSTSGVLVQELSPKMVELVRLSQIEADHDALNELFNSYEGTVDELHSRAFALCGLNELLATPQRPKGPPDPQRSASARQAAFKHASNREAAARQSAVSAKGKAAHAAVGRLNSRSAR